MRTPQEAETEMDNDKAPIVFKSEASLWDMMVPVNPDGRSAKPFNMRRWDMADGRIYRLAWGAKGAPEEKEVSFLNKSSGELLTFEYLGVEFADWAPGYGFLLLGKRLHPPVEEDPD